MRSKYQPCVAAATFLLPACSLPPALRKAGRKEAAGLRSRGWIHPFHFKLKSYEGKNSNNGCTVHWLA